MNKRLFMIVLSLACVLVASGQRSLRIAFDEQRTENRIQRNLYGFLLEHIYHSVSNGVWGENVWNRSFEETRTTGQWTVGDDGAVSMVSDGDSTATFRIGEGRDFTLAFDVKLAARGSTLRIGVRDQSRDGMPTNGIAWLLDGQLLMDTGWVWYHPQATRTTAALKGVALSAKRWTRLALRCQGDTLTGSADGCTIFRQHIANCPKDGAITIGGQGKLLFRHIAVNGGRLDLSPVRHWQLVGAGSICSSQHQPLNDHRAVLLQSTGAMAGVEQRANFPVSMTNPLSGSVFLKGTVSSAVISLEHNGRTLAAQRLTGITGEWKEYPFVLNSQDDADDATLRIHTEEKGKLWIDQISMMHQSSIANGGFRQRLTDAVVALHPALLRWPGGSFLEHYRFEDGIGPQSQRRGKLRWDDFDPLSFGTDEYIAFCRKVGAEPQIVVPIGYHNYRGYAPGQTDWLQRALDWMDYCNGDSTTYWGRKRIANGHAAPYNVRYWELDNEVWKMDARQYVSLVKQFATAMRQRYPEIKIIGCGCGRLGREGAGLDSLLIAEAAPYIDYISPHYYQAIDKFGTDGVEEYGRYLDQLGAWIAASAHPEMRIYVSEWNLDGIDLRTGLFAGGFLNRLERTPMVEMAAPALLLRHTSAPGWNNAFINFDRRGWFAAPNYVVTKLWSDHFQPNRIAVEGDAEPLNIVATASDDRQTVVVKVVNPTEEAITLTVSDAARFAHCSLEEVAGPLRQQNSMERPDAIAVRKATTEVSGSDVQLRIKPYSASVLTLEK